MRTSVLHTALAVALVVGTACKGPDSQTTDFDNFQGVARGANVVPAAADTTPRAFVNFNAATLGYSYGITVAPGGVLDSIAFYQVAVGIAVPGSATAILCAGAAACTATSGTATLVGAATSASIRTSMRAFGTQVVFFTTTSVRPAGSIRGTMYALPTQ